MGEFECVGKSKERFSENSLNTDLRVLVMRSGKMTRSRDYTILTVAVRTKKKLHDQKKSVLINHGCNEFPYIWNDMIFVANEIHQLGIAPNCRNDIANGCFCNHVVPDYI